MERIPYDEVMFHPHSFGDPDGRLFWWRGKLYRGIKGERVAFFKWLFDNGVIEKLAAQELLIGSEPTGLALDGYTMVIRHRSVPFVSYPQEWCAAMFKDAARAYLELVEQLVSQGLTLKDTHPWNLLFDGCRPVYVDLTSIRQITDIAHFISVEKFRRYYLYPLLLMTHGQERIARHLMPDYEGISSADLSLLMAQPTLTVSAALKDRVKRAVPDACRKRLKRGLESFGLLHSRKKGQQSTFDCLPTLRRELENIRLRAVNDDWSAVDSIRSSQDASAPALQSLDGVIARLQPSSVLIIGATRRASCRLATLAQRKVIAFAKDSTQVTRLYYDGRDKNLPLLPLVMDFVDPTPSRGLSSHLSIAAAERLQCDMVVAFGVVEQLVSERSLRFDQVVDGLAQFAKRFLIVDFVTPRVDNRKLETCSWCTAENFVGALSKKFRKISRSSAHAGGDGLLVCEN